MSRITVYTTEPCGYCRVAKALLAKRNVPYEEINLANDPEGRAELVRLTGMMTFPHVVIDGEPIGGDPEVVSADPAGLVGVDVPDARDPQLVEQECLDRGARLPRERVQVLRGELVAERLDAQPGGE